MAGILSKSRMIYCIVRTQFVAKKILERVHIFRLQSTFAGIMRTTVYKPRIPGFLILRGLASLDICSGYYFYCQPGCYS